MSGLPVFFTAMFLLKRQEFSAQLYRRRAAVPVADRRYVYRSGLAPDKKLTLGSGALAREMM
jgi:hypothetical protein